MTKPDKTEDHNPTRAGLLELLMFGKRFSQEELAKRAGVGQMVVSGWLTASGGPRNLEGFVRAARELGTTVEELFEATKARDPDVVHRFFVQWCERNGLTEDDLERIEHKKVVSARRREARKARGDERARTRRDS